MESIKVFAPGSVSNVGCGFDIFGYAIEDLGDIITVTKRQDEQIIIKEIIGSSLPLDPNNNIATVAMKALLEDVGIKQGLDITIEKLIPPGSGLGSSACSANAGVFAVNELFNMGKSKTELIPFAMQGELVASEKAHADNIAPSMLGGFQVVRSYDPNLDVFQIPTPKDLITLIIFPKVEIKTSEARKLLGDSLSLDQARTQWGNVSGLTTGLLTSNWDLIGRSLQDVFAEPIRKKLIPHYEQSKDICLKNGAIGYSISGSGPAMFALYKSPEDAKKPLDEIKKLYEDAGIPCMFHISAINNEGTKVLRR